jgi:hypothetical protein
MPRQALSYSTHALQTACGAQPWGKFRPVLALLDTRARMMWLRLKDAATHRRGKSTSSQSIWAGMGKKPSGVRGKAVPFRPPSLKNRRYVLRVALQLSIQWLDFPISACDHRLTWCIRAPAHRHHFSAKFECTWGSRLLSVRLRAAPKQQTLRRLCFMHVCR